MDNPFETLDTRLTKIETLLSLIVSNQVKPPRPGTGKRKDVAKHLNIALPTLDILLKTGQIPFFKIGAGVRIKWSDVEAYEIKKGAEAS